MTNLTLATSVTCGPCKMLKNKLTTLGLEVEVKEYTIGDDKEFFIKHNIRSVPRLVVDTDGVVEIIQGMDEIIEAIERQ